MANRLIRETSPYLLQHAHNPVDWFPWGEEALRHAREQNKPILLSIGYSSCHWCHVMERESFESPGIARLMNEHFINIKVDREERPDLDQIYMAAVQTLTGRGGWPLTAFLTPEGKPFYGGTYFPPEDRWGIRGLRGLLEDVAEAYRTRWDELDLVAERLQRQLQQALAFQPSKEPLTEEILNNAFHNLKMSFDRHNGGLGAAPKFPQPLAFEFLLHYNHRKRAPEALEMVELTLAKMARGGIRDHLGGGFHRYSTDAQWRVPHFEKMLYDNALLSRLYLHAYQATGKPLYRRIAEEVLAYIKREMLSPEGGFYSAQDADSEGVEGKFYLWSQVEISRLLGKEDAALFNRYFGVTEEANFEGGNILYETMSLESLASEMGLRPEELEESIIRSKKRLLESRERRIKPERDEKILTCWNGLMMVAFAEAANIVGSQDYARIAENNAAFLLNSLRGGPGLLRSYRDGKANLPGYLEDYAAVIGGLLVLHEATFQPKWIEGARNLADVMVEEFWDQGEKVFHDTGRQHERLFLRPRDLSDNVLPSGSSNATQVLLRLSIITGERNYAEVAEAWLQSVLKMLLDYPSSMANWLCALDFYLSIPREIAIIGPREDAGTRALLSILYSLFLPNKVVVGLSTEGPAKLEGMPLLEGRGMLDGHPTAYVCQKYTCLQPVTKPDELRKQLDAP